MLNIEKAEKELGWVPTLTADEAITNTIEWYKHFYNNEEMLDYTMNQIKEYEHKIKWDL